MEETSQTRFNMSSATLARLDRWLDKAMEYYGRGNIPKYFDSLMNIAINSQFKFSKEQRKSLKVIENKYAKSITRGHQCKYAKEYHEELLDMMDEYGLLLPDKINDSETSY